MRKNLIKTVSILSFFIVAIVTFNACNTNLCQNISCQNNGTCREGACACPSGYEGSFCENALTDKFVGIWEGYEKCNGGVQTYVRYICVPGASPSEMIIYPIEDQTLRIVAKVVPGNSTRYEIPLQKIYKNLDEYTFQGSGYTEKDNYIYLYIQKTNPLTPLSSCFIEGEIKKIP